MSDAKCRGCGFLLAWFDHPKYNKGLCRQCSANARGKCGKIVYDSSNSRDVLGHACSFKAVGPSPRWDSLGKGFPWSYCKRHGGEPEQKEDSEE